MKNKIKRIAYGVSDFEAIQRDKSYYVDKTNFIPEVEDAGKFLFLIRPRRFGKSLWLSVMESYYDVAKLNRFDEIFGGTWIHENPTDEKNSYLMLCFNFSAVNPSIKELEASFEFHVSLNINSFCDKYKDLLDSAGIDEILKTEKSYDKLSSLFNVISKANLKLFIILDEYDNFANTILSSQGHDKYKELTHGEGFFRYFFNVLKSGATGSGAGLSKLFITGVSPVTMDDVTSGFNIGNNLSTDVKFNEILGFTDEQVKEMLEYYRENELISGNVDELFEIMSEWYNNYRFSELADVRMFNTDMVLYFVKKLISEGTLPRDLIDVNVKTDYKKLRHLIVLDQKLNGNFSRIKQIVEDGEISARISTGFSVEELLNPDNFISLLFFLGLLTITKVEGGKTYFKIPNITVEKLFYGYLRDAYKDVDVFNISMWEFVNFMADMAYKGEWENVFKYLSDAIEKQTSVRDYLSGEKVIQGFLLAYLNVTDFFLIRSEYESGKGFADLYCEPFLAKYPDMKYSYLIELKYIKREDYTEKLRDEKIEEAHAQLEKYANAAAVTKTKGNTVLKKIILVYSGWELVRMEMV